MKKKSPLKPFDIPVIALALALALVIALRVYSGEAASSRVVVRDPESTWIFPINAEEIVSATGPLGETVVSIHEGRAAIVSSPCSGQACVAAGELRRNGQWVACLPNRVFLRIEGAKEPDAIDAVSW